MKLHFTKTKAGEIEASIFENEQNTPFSYIEMVKSIINGKEIECSFSEEFDNEEKEKINDLKDEINRIVEKEKNALDI